MEYVLVFLYVSRALKRANLFAGYYFASYSGRSAPLERNRRSRCPGRNRLTGWGKQVPQGHRGGAAGKVAGCVSPQARTFSWNAFWVWRKNEPGTDTIGFVCRYGMTDGISMAGIRTSGQYF